MRNNVRQAILAALLAGALGFVGVLLIVPRLGDFFSNAIGYNVQSPTTIEVLALSGIIALILAVIGWRSVYRPLRPKK